MKKIVIYFSKTTDGKFIISAFYHNQEGLVVEERQTMPDNALLCQRTTYSFTRKPLTIETQVKKGEIDKTITPVRDKKPFHKMSSCF